MKLPDGTGPVHGVHWQPSSVTELGCHSSRHNKPSKANVTAMETESSSGSDGDNGDIEVTPEDWCESAAYASFLK